MPESDKRVPVNVAVYGGSGAGKTVLLSSLFDCLGRPGPSKGRGYVIRAENKHLGNRLLLAYEDIIKKGDMPDGTAHMEEFRFSLGNERAMSWPLQFSWFDYRGGIWDQIGAVDDDKNPLLQEPKSLSDLKTLASCIAGLLIVDGEDFVSNPGGSIIELTARLERLGTIRKAYEKKTRFLWFFSGEEITYPEEWVIALTKADRMPDDYSAKTFCDEFLRMDRKHGLPFAQVAEKLGVQDGLGHRFMILSSFKQNGGPPYERGFGVELLPAVLLRSSLEGVVKKITAELAKAAKNEERASTILKGTGEIASMVSKLEKILPTNLKPFAQLGAPLIRIAGWGASHHQRAANVRSEIGEEQGSASDLVDMLLRATEEDKRCYHQNQY